MFGYRWLKIPPIPGITMNELSRVEDRLGSILMLAASAVVVYLIDTRLHQWVLNGIVTVDILLRGWHHQQKLIEYLMGSGIMDWVANLWHVWSLIIWQVVPPRMRMTVHFGVAIYAINTILITSMGEYLEEDGPAYELYACIPAHRDGLVSFFLTAFFLRSEFCWSVASHILSSKLAVSAITIFVACFAISAIFRSVVVLGILSIIRPVLLRTEVIWDIFDALQAEWYRWKRDAEIHKNDWEWSHDVHECTGEFKYKPLRPGEIRILQMYRAQGGAAEWWKVPGTIEAKMRHVNLSYPGAYEAVSYHWGEKGGTTRIMVDNAEFTITNSAYEVLRARRSMQATVDIWIDAICIDQSNAKEKSTQIQLMRDIYRKAKRVIAFPCSDPIVRLTAPLLFQIAEDTPAYDHHDSLLSFRPIFALQRLSPRWMAMATLLNSEYFRRAWVIQELDVGNNVQFYLGGLYLSIDDLFKAVGHFKHPPRIMALLATCEGSDPALAQLGENVMRLIQLRPNDDDRYDYNLSYEERTAFSTTIMHTTKFRASDPRDLIYAKLGVATDLTNSDLIRPDYDKSVAQVFIDATRYLFVYSASPSLHVLSLAGAGFGPRNLSLPSWVPDFSHSITHRCFTALGHDMTKTAFSVSSGTFQAALNMTYAPKEHDGCLILKGIGCDQILAISTSTMGTAHKFSEVVPKSYEEVSEFAKDWRNSILSLQDLLHSHQHMLPEADLLEERVGRLLIAFSPVVSPPSTKHGKLYRTWVENLQSIAQDPLAVDRLNQNVRTGAGGFTYQETEVESYAQAASLASAGRRVAITTQGRMCLVPPLTLADDIVFIPFGAQTPYICRPLPSSGEAVLMGDAYVEGLMMGEVFEQGLQQSVVDMCLR